MNLSLSGATDFFKAKAKTPGINVFIPKLICYHIHEKSMYIFTETIRPLILCVSCQFSRVFVFVFYISFNFSIFVSLALKIHNCTTDEVNIDMNLAANLFKII